MNKERLISKPTPRGEVVSVGRTADATTPARITISPQWVEVARIYTRFAECAEHKACVHLTPEILRMGRMADVLNELMRDMPEAKRNEIKDRIKE